MSNTVKSFGAPAHGKLRSKNVKLVAAVESERRRSET